MDGAPVKNNRKSKVQKPTIKTKTETKWLKTPTRRRFAPCVGVLTRFVSVFVLIFGFWAFDFRIFWLELPPLKFVASITKETLPYAYGLGASPNPPDSSRYGYTAQITLISASRARYFWIVYFLISFRPKRNFREVNCLISFKIEKRKMPLLKELSRTSRDSFESESDSKESRDVRRNSFKNGMFHFCHFWAN